MSRIREFAEAAGARNDNAALIASTAAIVLSYLAVSVKMLEVQNQDHTNDTVIQGMHNAGQAFLVLLRHTSPEIFDESNGKSPLDLATSLVDGDIRDKFKKKGS